MLCCVARAVYKCAIPDGGVVLAICIVLNASVPTAVLMSPCVRQSRTDGRVESPVELVKRKIPRRRVARPSSIAKERDPCRCIHKAGRVRKSAAKPIAVLSEAVVLLKRACTPTAVLPTRSYC